MPTFWSLLQDSIIIQGMLTLGVLGTTLFLYAMGKEVPDTLIHFSSLVLGFWFGTKIQHVIRQAARPTKGVKDAKS